MTDWLKFALALALAFLLMCAFRTLALSVCAVSGTGLAPLYNDGDRLLLNRWSYGLRIEGGALLPPCRLLRRPVMRGDVVAFALPGDTVAGIMIARCTAVPGDTLHTKEGPLLVPGVQSCADADYYWLESINRKNPADSRRLGFISEQCIIGRVVTVLYNRHTLYQR